MDDDVEEQAVHQPAKERSILHRTLDSLVVAYFVGYSAGKYSR